MAFTSTERMKCRTYLGFPGVSTLNYYRLEGALDRVGADSDALAECQAILADLVVVESEMSNLHGIALASDVGRDGSLNPNRYRDLRAAGRRNVQRLATLIGLDPARDYFSTGWNGGPLAMG